MHIRTYPAIISIVLLLHSCSSDTHKTQHVQTQQPEVADTQTMNVQIMIFKNDTTHNATLGGYGYNIYVIHANDTLRRLHQPSIPAIQGNKGFKTREDAEKIAALASMKVKDGNSFPTISIEELDSLGIDIK